MKINKISLNVVLLACFFILFFTWFTLREFQRGMMDGYDQGTYSQILWTTLHGKLFWCSFTGPNGLCDLGVHMDPILLFLAPFYALFPSPITLNIIQVFLLGIGVIPIYLIAKEKINNRVGLLFVIFYLTNTFIIQAIIEGFQARTLTVPLFLFAFYFLVKNKYFLFSLFILLLCLSHGISCLLVFMLGIYIILIRRKTLLGIAISILSLGWFILSIKVLQPYFGISEPLGALHFTAGGRILSDPTKIIYYCFSHPIDILQRIFSYPKLDYLLRLFAPLGFLSLFSLKELLIGLPIFLQNLFLSEQLIKIEVPRYTMPLLPFIFVSAIYSLAHFFKKMKLQWIYIEILIIISLVMATYRFVLNPLYNPRFLQVLSPISRETKVHREALKIIANLVPPDAGVCADVKAFPFLANRFKLYDMPFHIEESEYVLIDKKEPVFSPKPIMSREEYLEIMNRTLNSSNYEIVREKDQIILLKRKK